jgi:hypothetical protein
MRWCPGGVPEGSSRLPRREELALHLDEPSEDARDCLFQELEPLELDRDQSLPLDPRDALVLVFMSRA